VPISLPLALPLKIGKVFFREQGVGIIGFNSDSVDSRVLGQKKKDTSRLLLISFQKTN
jgi:hypothetical protein